MKTVNEALYAYLQDHAVNMTNEWLKYNIGGKGSIYSVSSDEYTVDMLREQNRLTIEAIATRLAGNNDNFDALRNEWARIVAESRIRSKTPIHEVFDAVMRFRTIYWSFIERFIRENNDDVKRPDILRWGREMDEAFDELFHEFSKTYYELTEARINAQQAMIEELGTPVIKIDFERGILPLVGDIDTERARILKTIVPQRCMDEDILHLFIDLSGVAIVDSMVAQQMHELTQTLSLLGIRSTLTGIRPEIAQTTVNLGLDFKGVGTYGSLRQALEETPVLGR